jgi:hypothetical protein
LILIFLRVSEEYEEGSLVYSHYTPVRSTSILLNCFIETNGDNEIINSLIRFLSGFRLENGLCFLFSLNSFLYY